MAAASGIAVAHAYAYAALAATWHLILEVKLVVAAVVVVLMVAAPAIVAPTATWHLILELKLEEWVNLLLAVVPCVSLLYTPPPSMRRPATEPMQADPVSFDVLTPNNPSDGPHEEFEVLGPSGRLYSGSSFCCFLPGRSPRRDAILLVESWAFDHVVLLTIMCNCLTMACASPLDPPGTSKAHFIGVCEWFFLAIFTAELSVKMLAYGVLFTKQPYLRDAWCQLDFLVVSLAWLPILLPSVSRA